MKLKLVMSGGQTGADLTGLEEAKKLGLETGGTAPKGYKTERGANFDLRDLYGLKESHTSEYAARTHQNAGDAEITIWFGNTNSPGYWCTRAGCKKHGKPFEVNPSELQLEYFANNYESWNVAGNRESKNPGVVGLVRKAFETVKKVKEGN